MLRRNLLSLFLLSLFAVIPVGCGGNVSEGVADGPEEEYELTEEEIAGEEEATKDYN